MFAMRLGLVIGFVLVLFSTLQARNSDAHLHPDDEIIVPVRFEYCETDVELTPEARQQIQNYVDQIRKNILSHKVLVERAQLYFTIIEEAFFRIGVPEDLKYIAIQESGLRGDAISTSKAVGYWQFKDYTGKEVGLRIDSNIDERRHVFRASIGAARYFATNYFRHRNWVYAILSYYAGGTGAIPYVKDEHVGSGRIVLDENMHWYVFKAIAHKFAYQNETQANSKPNRWLEPLDIRSETDIHSLIELSGNSPDIFKTHNRWIMKDKWDNEIKISMYVLHENKTWRKETDPFAYLYPTQIVKSQHTKPFALAGKPIGTANQELTDGVRKVPDNKDAGLEQAMERVNEIFIEKDSEFGTAYTLLTPQFNLVDASLKYGVKVQRLKDWNDVKQHTHPKHGTVISLVHPKKAHFHVVNDLETLEDISGRYRVSVSKLRQLNHLGENTGLLTPGRKIYLKDERPAHEPVLLLLREDPAKAPKTVVITPPVPPKKNPIKPQTQTVAPQKPVVEIIKPQENQAPADTTDPWEAFRNRPKKSSLLYTPDKKEEVSSRSFDEPLTLPSKEVPVTSKTASFSEHTVSSGETLWAIAQKYGTDVDQIRSLNRLTEQDVIQVGDKLKIPKSTTE